ncbi:putative sugar nucleotidyl transferase [Thalassoroseus pseudoceratinae]|uniref:putative sugar nucleotidyl transferase n=1 Tax=Thalassoroseus pseudoceratinae TaxID=2713176 RepID=UPI001423D400|nr:putative sugar nucleotidyl transferase [Thalassoroseus pseudoceratinae]
MRIAFYEDERVKDLAPLTLTRPAYELLCGRFSVRERWQDHLSTSSEKPEWLGFVRPELAAVCRERNPEVVVNDFVGLQYESTLLINGRWIDSPADALQLTNNEVGMVNGTIVALRIDPEEAILLTEENFLDAITDLAETRQPRELTGCVAGRPWDLVSHNSDQLNADFTGIDFDSGRGTLGQQVAIMGSREMVFVHRTAEVHPFVVLDARSGPISIDADAVVQPFTRIEGPCHIGRGSQIFRAHIKEGSSIGPVCRVGGEVEASILHSYVNKYHDGFLGHSYVCPWVNLGALSTNSDLKNDYSNVNVPMPDGLIDTEDYKVGCYIGDHTKAAIGSLFNTGSCIGVMCMILPGGELLPKHVPSFARIWHGDLCAGWEINRSLETARIAMQRRGQELTAAEEQLLRRIERQTFAEREHALHRWEAKQAGIPA